MVVTTERADVATLPPAPRNPLPYWRQVGAVRSFHTGQELLRDAGGPVTRMVLGPKWAIPPIVLVTSPAGIRDVLNRRDALSEDRKSTRLNSSHVKISYAVFCLKKKKNKKHIEAPHATN